MANRRATSRTPVASRVGCLQPKNSPALTAFRELIVLPLDEVRVITRTVNALTPRERQVLEALVRGNTTREIASTYGLGRQTVKNYVTVIYEKCGVSDRSQLLRLAQSSVASPLSAGEA